MLITWHEWVQFSGKSKFYKNGSPVRTKSTCTGNRELHNDKGLYQILQKKLQANFWDLLEGRGGGCIESSFKNLNISFEYQSTRSSQQWEGTRNWVSLIVLWLSSWPCFISASRIATAHKAGFRHKGPNTKSQDHFYSSPFIKIQCS